MWEHLPRHLIFFIFNASVSLIFDLQFSSALLSEAVELFARDQRGDRLAVAATSAPAGSAAVQICRGFSEHPEGQG